MSVPIFKWPAVGQFVGRNETIATLEAWWKDSAADPLNLFGRRRVGKSWLFRKLAHGKKAIILVAEKTTQAQQLSKMAEQLEPFLGVRPAITDIGTLFKILYKIAGREKVLVVVDEFPDLLGSSKAEIAKSLSSVQAAMEQGRDASKIKLILCGSALAQMESMQELKSPLHGRFRRFELSPLTFAEARDFFHGSDVIDHLTRYSVSGGMPKYLAHIGKCDFAKAICDKIVSPNSPLYAEVESLLESELRDPATYFAILAELAVRPKDVREIADAIGKESKILSEYLRKLEIMRIIRKKLPVGADPKSRAYQWECIDGFIRFWFRFVLPYKADLEAGGDPRTHVDHHIMPVIAEHTSLEFERVFRRWVSQNFPAAAHVGNWWGKATPALAHSTEEIDIVGIKGKRVLLLGEAKWTNENLKATALTLLETNKIPALVLAGFTVPNAREVILASRSGFSKEVVTIASKDPRIHLVVAGDLLRNVV